MKTNEERQAQANRPPTGYVKGFSCGASHHNVGHPSAADARECDEREMRACQPSTYDKLVAEMNPPAPRSRQALAMMLEEMVSKCPCPMRHLCGPCEVLREVGRILRSPPAPPPIPEGELAAIERRLKAADETQAELLALTGSDSDERIRDVIHRYGVAQRALVDAARADLARLVSAVRVLLAREEA